MIYIYMYTTHHEALDLQYLGDMRRCIADQPAPRAPSTVVYTYIYIYMYTTHHHRYHHQGPSVYRRRTSIYRVSTGIYPTPDVVDTKQRAQYLPQTNQYLPVST